MTHPPKEKIEQWIEVIRHEPVIKLNREDAETLKTAMLEAFEHFDYEEFVEFGQPNEDEAADLLQLVFIEKAFG